MTTLSFHLQGIKDLRTGLKKACTEAEILYGRFKGDGFTFHDLRRTFYTDMRKAGIQESVIKGITGHSRNEVSDRYNQVDIEDMRQAVERLTQYRREQIESVDQTPIPTKKEVSQTSANSL